MHLPSNNCKELCALLLLIRNKVSAFKSCTFYYKIQTINAVLALFTAMWQIAVTLQFKRQHSTRDFSTLIQVTVQNKHEWTSEGMSKDKVQLTEMYHISCNKSISVSTQRKTSLKQLGNSMLLKVAFTQRLCFTSGKLSSVHSSLVNYKNKLIYV